MLMDAKLQTKKVLVLINCRFKGYAGWYGKHYGNFFANNEYERNFSLFVAILDTA